MATSTCAGGKASCAPRPPLRCLCPGSVRPACSSPGLRPRPRTPPEPALPPHGPLPQTLPEMPPSSRGLRTQTEPTRHSDGAGHKGGRILPSGSKRDSHVSTREGLLHRECGLGGAEARRAQGISGEERPVWLGSVAGGLCPQRGGSQVSRSQAEHPEGPWRSPAGSGH